PRGLQRRPHVPAGPRPLRRLLLPCAAVGEQERQLPERARRRLNPLLSRGARVHDYEVWGRLGEGGMSDVWLAKHSVLCVPVVFKTLRKDIAEAVGEAGARRMFNEARLMARVTSPRVVRAVDAGTLEGTPYLVQEYVDGVDLAELDRERRGAL